MIDELGITWNEFLSRYVKMLQQVQRSYGVKNPELLFNLLDMEKFFDKTASKAPAEQFTLICYLLFHVPNTFIALFIGITFYWAI